MFVEGGDKNFANDGTFFGKSGAPAEKEETEAPQELKKLPPWHGWELLWELPWYLGTPLVPPDPKSPRKLFATPLAGIREIS